MGQTLHRYRTVICPNDLKMMSDIIRLSAKTDRDILSVAKITSL